MTRETIEAKAARYLAEGRLRVLMVKGSRVFAECTGSATYHLGCTDGVWWCHCPARGRCAHLLALALVVPLVPAHGLVGSAR